MKVHIHRNSFTGGEISPLMDARFDDPKYASSCRILQNYLPRVYGGAFRRPGTMFLDKGKLSAIWEDVGDPGYEIGIFYDGADNPPTQFDDTFDVGALWLYNDRTAYYCNSGAQGAASWSLVAAKCNLLAGNVVPTVNDDASDGYSVGSIWYAFNFETVWICSDASAGAAVWEQVTLKTSLTGETAPTVNDDIDKGYQAGSVWIKNDRTLYVCEDDTHNAAVWTPITEKITSVRRGRPLGINDQDDGYTVGSYWIENDYPRIWKLTALDEAAPVRLMDFNASADVRYVLAFGDGWLKIYTPQGEAFKDIKTMGKPDLVLRTPYSAEEVHDVQVAQLGNVAYFAHPAHPPQKLTRTIEAGIASDYFYWSQVEYRFPVLRDSNITDVTATPSATSGMTEITFSADPFVETFTYDLYNGARIMLAQRRDDSHVKVDLSSGGTSSELIVLGSFEVHTYGKFSGTIKLQAKDKAGNWTTIKSFEANEEDNRQILYTSSMPETTALRIDAATTSSGGDSYAYLEAADSRRFGYARILNGIRAGSIVPVMVEEEFDSTDPTTEWAIEAWAPYAGYPRAVCFHEQRLWFGGTELQPNTFWGSAVNDFENFRRGPNDADAVAFTLAAQEGSSIQSMVSHDAMVVFTQSEEWTVTTSQNTAITPANIFVRRQSRFGSSYRQAFVAANNLIFVQRGGTKVRQFEYALGQLGGQGVSQDLTETAEHITRGGIRQMAYQQQHDPVLWCVTVSGGLLSMSYEPERGIIAWARHVSGGAVIESVAVVYGDAGASDEVWIVANRDGERFIERIDPDAGAKLDAEDMGRMVYVDAAKIVELSPAGTNVTGLEHLEGKTVSILADGAVHPDRVVSAGQITLEDAASVVVVGLPYESILQPSKIDADFSDGTAQGRKMIAKRFALNLWKTHALQHGASPTVPANQWHHVRGRSTATPIGQPEPLFTGMVDVVSQGRHGWNVDFTIRQTAPLPSAILALIPVADIAPN